MKTAHTPWTRPGPGGRLRWPAQAGWPGAVALLAGLATVVLAAGLTPHWTAQAARTKAQTGAQQRALAAQAAAVRPPAAVARPMAFDPLAGLPEAQTHPQRVADLLAQALHHGVRVDRLSQTLATPSTATTSTTTPTSTRLPAAALRPAVTTAGLANAERSSLQMQASGHVPALRAWASAVLVQDPALALDSLRWRRASGSEALWTAEMHWSLWQQAEARAEARP